MKAYSLKSLQYYAKRNDIHTTESTIHHSSPVAPNIDLPPLPEEECAEEESKEMQEELEEDWEDLEPNSKPDEQTTKPKRRKYQVNIHRRSFLSVAKIF